MAGGESAYLTNLLTQYNVRDILYSYYWLERSKDLAWFLRQIEEGRRRGVRYMLDSGAFTYQARVANKHKPVPVRKYLDGYLQFVDTYGHLFEVCAEFDLAGHELAGHGLVSMDDVEGWRQELVHAAGVSTSVMPVYHKETWTKEEWRDMCQSTQYKYLGIGGQARESGDKQLVYKSMIAYAHAHGKRVHGFAATKVQTNLKKLYWDSVDSGSWITAQSYGTTFLFRAGQWTQVEPYQKDQRKRYVSHFRSIGLDPKKILADDETELIKASVMAWRDLSAWYQEKRARLHCDVDKDAQALLVTGRPTEKNRDPMPPQTPSERPRRAQKRRTPTDVDTPFSTPQAPTSTPAVPGSGMDQNAAKTQLLNRVLAVAQAKADRQLAEAIRRRDARRAAASPTSEADPDVPAFLRGAPPRRRAELDLNAPNVPLPAAMVIKAIKGTEPTACHHRAPRAGEAMWYCPLCNMAVPDPHTAAEGARPKKGTLAGYHPEADDETHQLDMFTNPPTSSTTPHAAGAAEDDPYKHYHPMTPEMEAEATRRRKHLGEFPLAMGTRTTTHQPTGAGGEEYPPATDTDRATHAGHHQESTAAQPPVGTHQRTPTPHGRGGQKQSPINISPIEDTDSDIGQHDPAQPHTPPGVSAQTRYMPSSTYPASKLQLPLVSSEDLASREDTIPSVLPAGTGTPSTTSVPSGTSNVLVPAGGEPQKVVPYKTEEYARNFAEEASKLLSLPGLHCAVCTLEESCSEFVVGDTRPCHIQARFKAFPVRNPDNLLGAEEYIIDRLKERLFRMFYVEQLQDGGVPTQKITTQAIEVLKQLRDYREQREAMEGESVRTSSGRGTLSKLFGDIGAAQINIVPAHQPPIQGPPPGNVVTTTPHGATLDTTRHPPPPPGTGKGTARARKKQ